MAAYVVAQITIEDRERYRDYEAGFMAVLDAHGGELVAGDDAAEVLEGNGDAGARHVVLRFADKSAARAWYESVEYQAIAAIRHEASTGVAMLVQGR